MASKVPARPVTMEDVKVETVDDAMDAASAAGGGVIMVEVGPGGPNGFGL